MGENEIKQVLDQLVNKITGDVDAKEFLDKLLFGENHTYIDEFHRDFKDNFFKPLAEKFKNLYDKIKNNLSQMDDKKVKSIVDPFDLGEFTDQIKNKKTDWLKKLDEKYKNILRTENIENTGIERIDNTNTEKILPQQTKTIKVREEVVREPSYKNPNIKTNVEQRGFGPEIETVAFSTKTQEFLQDLLRNFENDFLKRMPTPKIVLKSEDQKKTGYGLGGLVLGFIGELIAALGKVKDAFKFIFELPSKIKTFFTERGILSFKDFQAWVELQFEDKVLKPLRKIPGFEKLENFLKNVSGKIGEAFESVKNKFTDFIKFDEIKLRWTNAISDFKNFIKFDSIVESIKNGVNFVLEPIISFATKIKNFFVEIPKLISADKGFSAIGNIIKSLVDGFKSFEGPLAMLGRFLSPVLNIVKGLSEIISIPLIQTFDGIITAFKTFFNVFNDENLSPIQKGISVVSGFFGGLGSLIPSVVDIIGKIISVIPGLSKVGDSIERLAKIIDTHDFGNKVTDLQKTINSSTDLIGDLKRGMGLGKEYWQTDEYIKASPEEKRKIDQDHMKISPKSGDNLKNQNPVVHETASDVPRVKQVIDDRGVVHIPDVDDKPHFLATKDGDPLIKALNDIKGLMTYYYGDISALANKETDNSNITSLNISSGDGGGSADDVMRYSESAATRERKFYYNFRGKYI